MKGLTLKRGLQTNNAVLGVQFDREDVQAEQKTGTRRHTARLYDPVVRNEDRTLKAGEMAFAMIDPREEFTVEYNPYVRTVLNGVHVRTTSMNEPDPKKRTEKLKRDLMESIRLVGFVIQDVVYPGPSPSGVPALKQAVVAVSGYMTITNTGDKRIESGDAIRCVLVDKTKKNQYRDANRFSPGRIVLGYEPLEMHTELNMELKECDGESDFVDTINAFFNHIDPRQPKIIKPALMGAFEDKEVAKAGNELLAAFRAKEMYDARNVLGVAQTPANAGERADAMITQLLNLTTYAKPKPVIESNIQ